MTSRLERLVKSHSLSAGLVSHQSRVPSLSSLCVIPGEWVIAIRVLLLLLFGARQTGA